MSYIHLPPNVTLEPLISKNCFDDRKKSLFNVDSFLDSHNYPNNEFRDGSSSDSTIVGRNQRIIEEIGITDEELITIKTKQLNRLLKGIPKERQKEIKSERRTLKNRGYADNCRKKRLMEKEQIEIQLREMTKEVERNKKQLRNNRLKIMELIKSSDDLLRSLDQYESGHELKEKIKEKVRKENPPIKDHIRKIYEQLGVSKSLIFS